MRADDLPRSVAGGGQRSLRGTMKSDIGRTYEEGMGGLVAPGGATSFQPKGAVFKAHMPKSRVESTTSYDTMG